MVSDVMPKGTRAATEGSQHPHCPGVLKEKAGTAWEKPLLHFLALRYTAEDGATRDSAQA